MGSKYGGIRVTEYLLLLLLFAGVGYCQNNNTDTVVGNNGTQSSDVDIEKEVLKKWMDFNKRAGDMVEDLIKRAFPLLTEINSEVEISPTCTTSLLKVVFALRNLRSWAVKMIDASGRPPPGLLVGSISALGNFDECMTVHSRDEFSGEVSLRGQYCAINLRPALIPKPHHVTFRTKVVDLTNLTGHDEAILDLADVAPFFYRVVIRLGLCIPDACTHDDLQSLANIAVKETIFSAEVAYCQQQETDGKNMETLQIVILSLLGFMLLMMVAGTWTEWLFTVKKVGSNAKDIMFRFFQCFSVRRNFNTLMDTSGAWGKLDALDGIRVLSMGWIVLVHTYAFVHKNGVGKLESIRVFLGHWTFSAIVNAWVSVDSFFMIGGILVAYTTLRSMEKQNGDIGIIRFALRRIFRLAPCMFLAAGILFLLPLLDNGPNWPETIGAEVEKCKNLWWGSLFFLNSWMNWETMCLIHTWYVSADIQLYLLSPLPIYLLYRRPKIGFFVCFLLVAISTTVSGIMTYIYDLYPTIMYLSPDEEFMQKIGDKVYLRPYSHLGPYVVGIVVGYLVLKHRTVQIKKGLSVLGWLVSLLMLAGVLYGAFPWHDGYLPSRNIAAIYGALHRTAWAVGLGWIVFACATGHGGPINALLSWPVFKPLSRLTYLTYLLHMLSIWQRNSSRRERFYIRHYNLIYEFFGNVVTSVCLAFLFHLLVEAPFAALDKVIFPPKKEQPKPKNEAEEPSHFVAITKFTPRNTPESVGR